MLEQLIEKQQRFTPFLKLNDYTYIGPTDENLHRPFLRAVTQFGTARFFDYSLHTSLSNTTTVSKALEVLPPGTPLGVFVVNNEGKWTGILYHSTLKEYCDCHGIEFL